MDPLVGATKEDDIAADVRMRCYEILLEHYYPLDRVTLAINPAQCAMPSGEAIFHALVAKKTTAVLTLSSEWYYAGVGDYYGTYDAQYIFEEFAPGELGIVPMKFEHAFYCTRTKQMATSKTSPSRPEERIHLSGQSPRNAAAW